MAPSLADLPPELIEEVLFRLPPADPASLVRAAAVCKSWCGLISGRRFRRRFREFHRAAPMIKASTSILKYNLATREASLIHLPPRFYEFNIALTVMEDGGLGIARVEGYKLLLSSMEASPKGNVEWTETGVIELKKLLPDDAFSTPCKLIFLAHGVGVFFVGTDNGLFTIDVIKPGTGAPSLFPYNRFYMPALGASFTDEEPRVGASSA